MAKRRYLAPTRGALAPDVLAHPIFAGYDTYRPWLEDGAWPTFAALNAALDDRGVIERFVPQDAALLADGLHYESRIAERGEIATRPENWHDLLNALAWIEHPALKRALNRRQVAEIVQVGTSQRSRAQCALTHFDEGGAIVVLRDAGLLALWDAHDWHGLFWRERAAWSDGRADVLVFGHALLEHALTPGQLITAKCLAVLIEDEVNAAPGSAPSARARADAVTADAVAQARALNDPQELRPLPLSGMPGWHPATADAAFYLEADCFRPLRAGRTYPAPLMIG
jgi:hypothetical protein